MATSRSTGAESTPSSRSRAIIEKALPISLWLIVLWNVVLVIAATTCFAKSYHDAGAFFFFTTIPAILCALSGAHLHMMRKGRLRTKHVVSIGLSSLALLAICLGVWCPCIYGGAPYCPYYWYDYAPAAPFLPWFLMVIILHYIIYLTLYATTSYRERISSLEELLQEYELKQKIKPEESNTIPGFCGYCGHVDLHSKSKRTSSIRSSEYAISDDLPLDTQYRHCVATAIVRAVDDHNYTTLPSYAGSSHSGARSSIHNEDKICEVVELER